MHIQLICIWTEIFVAGYFNLVMSTRADSNISNCTIILNDNVQCNCSSRQDTNGSNIICVNTTYTYLPRSLMQPVHLTFTSHRLLVLQPIVYPSLAYLKLDDNQLYIIKNDAFQQLSNLQTLSLENNYLTGVNIQSPVFNGMMSLTFLSLHNNYLYEVARDTFVNSPALLLLHLQNCHIYNIHNGSINLPSLQELNVSQNNLADLNWLFNNNVKSMIVLDISHNDITSIPCLKDFPKLSVINLHHNLLTQLEADQVCLPSHLTFLDLRNNHIVSIDVQVFIPNATVHLSANMLQSLQWSAIAESTMVQLTAHDNPWNCTVCENKWFTYSKPTLQPEQPLLCFYPEETRGIPLYEAKSFSCGSSSSHEGHMTLLVVSLVFAFIAVFTIATVMVFCCRKQSRANGSRIGYVRSGSKDRITLDF